MTTSTLRESVRLATQALQALTQYSRHAMPSARAPLISCLQVPEAVPPSRLLVETQALDTVAALRGVVFGVGGKVPISNTSLTAVSQDTLLLIRGPVAHSKLQRLAQALRRAPRRSGRGGGGLVTRLNASAGMSLAAIMSAEERHWAPPSLLRLLSSADGPHRIGIGWIPPSLHHLLATLLALLASLALAWALLTQPQLVPWCVGGVLVAFATRPDLDSFFSWVKRTAPVVARRKRLLVDKLRASMAPYFMTWGGQARLSDYGLFSVVRLTDHADYVYVYGGIFSRWCLLGWYTEKDDYNFDRIAAHPLS